MNLYISIAVVAVLVIGSCENAENSKKAKMDSIIEFCQGQEKATDTDIEIWRRGTELTTRMLKCLDACVAEKMGLMTNNKLNVDAALTAFAAENMNEKSVALWKEILSECKEVTDPDRCEANAKISRCISDGLKKHAKKNSELTDTDSIIKFCQVQEKATDTDIEIWIKSIELKTRMSKCLNACVAEKKGLTINNKLNVDAFLIELASKKIDEKSLAVWKVILNDCKEVTDPDRCEANGKIIRCINDGFEKRGFKVT